MTPEQREIRALLIEDNPATRLIRETLEEVSASMAVEVVHMDRLAHGLDLLAARAVDVVLLDLSSPDTTGLDTFTQLHTAALA